MQRFLVVMIGAALASAAGAQSLPYQGAPDEAPYAPASAGQTQVDPPARVARLGYLSGNVSFTPSGESDWVQAQLNRPVVTGDKLWTDAGARAELQIGSSTIRLDQSSSFDFLNLDDQLAQMELTQGALNLDVRRLRGNESYEIDTPTIAFIANRVGDYRIDVNPAGYTVVTARRGGGDAIGEGGKRIRVEEGQSVRFNDSQLNDYQVNQIGAPDTFDSFANERGQRYVQAAPNNYVSEDVVGHEDLNQYGTWDDAPEYGHVWYPNEVAADWAPYHDGNWSWVDPWGWTWVDNSPWGYAPFHYGRWAYIGSRWGWVPGPVDIAPVYAPALVAFVGGSGFGVGFSIGGPIGWFALGPRDVYFPGYHCGRSYFDRVNYGGSRFVDRTVVNNYYGNWSSGRMNYAQINYTNRSAPGALTAMSGSAFVAGRSVRSSAVAVNGTTFANARVLPRATLAPTHESIVAGRGRGSAPPNAALNRNVIAAHQPPAAKLSFAQRQPLLQKNGGQPLTTSQMRTLAAHPGNARGAAANNNVRVVGNGGQKIAARAATATSGDRASAPANGRTAGTSPSRAADMNRSPAKANAQYLRSAGFAHQGVVPGSERSTTADAARGNAAARTNARVGQPANRSPEISSTNRATGNGRAERATAQQQGHLNSSHTQNGRAPAAARDNAMERRSAGATTNARGASSSSLQERSTVHAPQATSRALTQHSNPSVEAHARGSNVPLNARSTTMRSNAQEFSRSPNAGNTYQGERRSAPQYRASTQHVDSTRESRPAFTQHSTPVERPAAVQHSAPVQRSEPAHVQRQVTHAASAPVMRSEPPRVQQQVTRAPPPQEHAARPPHQVARSAPQHEPSGNDRKHEKDGGGR
jgi:hypothetical protein